MKKTVMAIAFLSVAGISQAEEPMKHVQVGIASYATVLTTNERGADDQEFTGFALQATGAPNDNFGVRGLYGQQDDEDLPGLDVTTLEASVLGGTGLATEGFKAYGSIGFFDEDWEAGAETIGFSGAMLGGGIGYNWEPVSVEFWMNFRDGSDYEDATGFGEVAAASGGLGIAARF